MVVYTEEAVFFRAVQQFVQLVERSAGGVPRQEGRLLGQIADQLQGNTLGEVPGPEKERGRERYEKEDSQTSKPSDRLKVSFVPLLTIH